MKKLSIIILSFSAKAVLAQVPATSNWFAVLLRMNKAKWELINDLGYRTVGMSTSAYIYYYRNGIRFKFNDTWNAAGGTAFFFTRSSYHKSNHEFGREFRLWQEVTFRKPLAKSLSLSDRFRTEERWFDSVSGRPAYFGFRVRDRLTVTKTINEKWSLEFGDEYLRMFANKKFLFNSNRILLLASYKMKGEMQIQGGYIWLKLPVSSQHVFTFAFQKNVSLRKSKNSGG